MLREQIQKMENERNFEKKKSESRDGDDINIDHILMILMRTNNQIQ